MFLQIWLLNHLQKGLCTQARTHNENIKLPFEASVACSEVFRFRVPNKSLPSPSSCERNDSTLSSKEPTSPKRSMSSCN